MLVLSRRERERIVLDVAGRRVVVEVVEVRGDGKVRVGFTAPDDVVILRSELLDRPPRGRRQAGMGGAE